MTPGTKTNISKRRDFSSEVLLMLNLLRFFGNITSYNSEPVNTY